MLKSNGTLSAILYLVEPGRKWRALTERFGPWHTVYWVKSPIVRKGVDKPGKGG